MRCISDKTSAHFFGIGDWGGDRAGGHVWDNPGRAASRGGKVPGPDDWGQKYVARQMNALADEVHPDYVLGVGDNFYPGGVESTCGNIEANIPQFDTNFNQIYTNLKDKPWYSVLGNHDYGGISFTSGWDSQIQRTWNVDNWIMPSQVYHTLVQYKDFSVRYFFLDSNHIDASSPPGDTHHNICQRGGCWDMPDINHCADVFARKWEAGVKMVEDVMANNTARGDWNIVVSHFPETGNEQRLRDAGVDLVFSGHYHHQRWNDGNLCKVDTLISGGGGGVTADDKPMTDGNDDSYGFIDFEINRTHLAINFMTWGGCQACDGNDPFQAQIRRKQIVKQPRQQGGCSGASVQSVSV